MREIAPINSKEDLLQRALEDPRDIIETLFWVVNKEKETVPFIFNRLQNEFYEQRTTRDDILKFSQGGFSTMILAIETVKFLLVPNSWSVCISHEDEATKRLFSKVEFFLEHMDDSLKQFLSLRTDSAHTLVNEITNSRFYIGTAGAKAFGRGDTVHYAHLSEVSRWKDQGRVATNLLRAVPLNDPNTWIVKETTANGQGNWHHVEWNREVDGKSEFKPYFAPWFKYEGYRIPGAVVPKETLDDEEMHLLKRHPEIDGEQLAWRRKMIRTLTSENGRSPEEMFKQEFPADPKEAFLFSGNPVFPTDAIQNYKDEAKSPIIRGNLVGVHPQQTIDETANGWLQIWEMPEEDGQYVIFGDVGQFSDFCSATVVDLKRWAVVAKFRANIQAYPFGAELNKLGYFYNTALIAVEVNNMGQSTADHLVSLKYPSLYMRERFDKKKKEKTEVVGWYTNGKTKALMIGFMQERFRAEDVDIPDDEILSEFSTYIRFPDGTMGASEGNWDDQVISTCGAFYIAKLNPYVAKKPKSNQVVQKVHKFARLRSSSKMKRWRTYR